MSDTAPSPLDAPTGALSTRTITDALGRRLSVREMDVVEQLDLYEVAGANSTSPAWLGTAMMVASVRTINDIPVPFPSNPVNLHGRLRRIGREGMDATLLQVPRLDGNSHFNHPAPLRARAQRVPDHLLEAAHACLTSARQ